MMELISEADRNKMKAFLFIENFAESVDGSEDLFVTATDDDDLKGFVDERK